MSSRQSSAKRSRAKVETDCEVRGSWKSKRVGLQVGTREHQPSSAQCEQSWLIGSSSGLGRVVVAANTISI